MKDDYEFLKEQRDRILKQQASVPVAALRALLAQWNDYGQDENINWFMRIGYADCADKLAALCDAAEKEKNK